MAHQTGDTDLLRLIRIVTDYLSLLWGWWNFIRVHSWTMNSFLRVLCVVCATTSSIQCHTHIRHHVIDNILFDYTGIDDSGLRHGEVAVDYEFCIPARADALSEINRIEPDARVLKKSKGRVGCTDEQWLCIINTRDPHWKKKLFAIAALPYVERIVETFYE